MVAIYWCKKHGNTGHSMDGKVCFKCKNENEDLMHRVEEYVSSPEGRCAIRKALEKADETTLELAKQRKVTPEDMKRRMTI